VHIPDHYLRRPIIGRLPDVGGFERLFAEQVKPATGVAIRYQLAAPKWQFVNACIHLDDNGAGVSYYYFSINHDALMSKPWVTGSVYVLPRETFEPEPEETWQGLHGAPTQWASSGTAWGSEGGSASDGPRMIVTRPTALP
jgi:hypothetical protein